MTIEKNIDPKTVEGFGFEWANFDQSGLSEPELATLWESYFKIFPWHALPQAAVGFDVGCGSGRWARLVAPRVGRLHCVDASSDALAVARRNLVPFPNCQFHHCSTEAMPMEDGSLDFGYSLGVLHHLPDTLEGLKACVRKLKPGAPFLVYLYYALDGKPAWYRVLWRASDALRRGISALPHGLRLAVCQVIALLVYWPLARSARLLEGLGAKVDSFPLAFYRRRSLYVMRTDALDRFGTRLERRFTREQIQAMMAEADLEDIKFSESAPYWCAVGTRSEKPHD